MKALRIILPFVSFLICFVSGYANWQREVTHFTPQMYAAGSYNNSIATRDNGWLYAANSSGLLEFDGSLWKKYPMPDDELLTIKIGDDGNVYAGGNNRFGYYVPNTLGGLDFIALSDSLPATTKRMPVKDIHISSDGVYYQSESYIYHWTGEKIKTIRSKSRITGSAIIRNHFYLATQRGLYVLNGEEPLPMANTGAMERMKVITLLPFDEKLLMVSSKDGLYLYDGYSYESYRSSADAFLSGKEIISATANDSLLVMGTKAHGIYLLNLHTGEGEAISYKNGLQDNTALSLAFDQKQNLWMGLNNGIDCIDLATPLYSIHTTTGMPGASKASALYNNQIYLGTNKGLFQTTHPSSFRYPFTEEPVHQITDSPVHALLAYDNRLFCASDQGLLILDRTLSQTLPVGPIYFLQQTGKQNEMILAVGESEFLFLNKVNNSWNISGRITNLPYTCTQFLATQDQLWIADPQKGILKLTLSEDLSDVIQEKSYMLSEGKNTRSVQITSIDDEIVFLSGNQFYRYNPSKDSIERFQLLENRLNSDNGFRYITQLDNGDIWYSSEDKLHLTRLENDTYIHRTFTDLLSGSHLSYTNTLLSTDRNNMVWGTDKGFVLFNPAEVNYREPVAQAQIRELYTINRKDSLIYGRNYARDDRPVQLEYKNNDIRFVFSGQQSHPGQPVRYSVKLDGAKNNQWSDFSDNPVKEYTGLPAGTYTFHVKTGLYGEELPAIASLTFRILPPWYATAWAWMLYILLVAGCIYFAWQYRSKIRSLLLSHRIGKEQNSSSETGSVLTGKVDTEGLQEELNDKTKELFRTTVSIIRKNEMLEDIRKKVLELTQTLEEEKATVSREKANRLLDKINSNIAHDEDMKAFAKSFDALHGNFFKLLEEKYPNLNQKDKMMCCYIKMNLISKEIAPLLNISVRGVEISRYRLRKKLNLQEKDNMAEYLQNIS